MSADRSPALDLPGAVPPPEGSPDEGVPWHYGDPHGEQRRLASSTATGVDLSHRGVVTVTGPDRLPWLHSLTTQHLEALRAGESTTALILSPHGHVEHELHVTDDGTTTWITTEPGAAAGLVAYLDSMRFMLRVDVADVSADWAVLWQPVREIDPERVTWLVSADVAGTGTTEAGSDRGGDAAKYVDHRPGVLVGREVLVPRAELIAVLGGQPAGTWALEALRVAAAAPRLGRETDHRTLPHEVGWIGPAVHLSKGCYRGQEAVARVHNLGSPPRRLVLLHLDGGAETLPAHGDPVLLGDREVGWVATPARHFELGPVATAVVKRNIDPGADLVVRTSSGDVAASQEPVVLVR
ncbi:MAG: YgfZ/GcvT domain-containing protein [bacterium]